MTQYIHQPHDKLFKQSMADVRVATEFFEAHLPKKLLAEIDLTTLQLQKETFVDETYKTTEADLIYTVLLGDSLAYLYLLCEHQSEVDAFIAFRLLVYIVRIMERHWRKYPNAPLPVTYPLVVYTGEPFWDAPRSMFELFGAQQALAEQVFLKPYQLIDVQRLSDDEIKQHFWSGLLEFVLKYRRMRDFASFLETLLPWLDKLEVHAAGSSLIKIVLNYVIDGVEADNETLFIQKSQEYLSQTLRGETMTLAQRFEQRGIEKGMQQGIRQGMQQGEYAILMRLLKQKFGTLPAQYQQLIDQADEKALLKWAERFVDAQSLKDIFND